MKASSICIVCSDSSRKEQANALARETGLPLLKEKSSDYDLQLCLHGEVAELYDSSLNAGIHVDFAEGTLAHRQQFGGGRGQAIARAIGLKKGLTPNVLDITAGLARDAYILACLGCKLTLVEQSPLLYALIEDGIRRGLSDPVSARVLDNFINLIRTDSVVYMKHMSNKTRPDVIYIDPMYPERKKSALVKKDMQILQRLLGKQENEALLLKTALQCNVKRVVVKRPVHAEPVNCIKPSTSISSKKTRYDIYLLST